MAHLGRGVRLLVCAAILQLLPASAVHAEGTTGAGRWSAPATLSSCPGTGTPQVVFPSDRPTRDTGPGAIVAWSDRRAGQTSVYLSRSEVGVRFGSPQLLESFPDPPGLPGYEGSPRLVRLSSESVMIAWTGAENGHWVVRTAAIDLGGVGAPSTISPPGSDALLAALAPGPDDEALALWTEPQPTPTGLDLGWQAIFAARGIDASPTRTIFAAAEQVAPPGPNSDATVAFDPDSDRAVVAWRTGAGAITYAIRAPGAPGG
jgi:hypothetical protein